MRRLRLRGEDIARGCTAHTRQTWASGCKAMWPPTRDLGGSVLGAGNTRRTSPLGTNQVPSKLTLLLYCQTMLGNRGWGGCVSGCRYVEGASCRPHMVALSTSSASTCSHLVLWARRSSVEKVRGGGAGRTALRKRVASGRCCEFGFSPLCGARAQWPPALCTLSGLIFM